MFLANETVPALLGRGSIVIVPRILEPRFSRANQALQSHVAAECLCLGGGALSDITFDHHICGDVGFMTGACRAGWNLTEGIYQQIVLHDFLRIRLDTFFSWLLCYTATLGVSQGHSWGGTFQAAYIVGPRDKCCSESGTDRLQGSIALLHCDLSQDKKSRLSTGLIKLRKTQEEVTNLEEDLQEKVGPALG